MIEKNHDLIGSQVAYKSQEAFHHKTSSFKHSVYIRKTHDKPRLLGKEKKDDIKK